MSREGGARGKGILIVQGILARQPESWYGRLSSTTNSCGSYQSVGEASPLVGLAAFRCGNSPKQPYTEDDPSRFLLGEFLHR